MKFDPASLSHNGIYRGEVLDNVDSTKTGKLKIEVLGIFTDIEKEYLPWAVPALPIFCGAGSGAGSFGVPAIGSWVWCFFEQGDHQQPVYFAEAPDGIHGFPVDGEKGYPDSRGWVTPVGHKFIFDDNGDVTIVHKDGSILTLSEDNINLSNGKNTSIDLAMYTITLNVGSTKMIVPATLIETGYLRINEARVISVSTPSSDLTKSFDSNLKSLFITS